jgi:hypothetical protein
MANLVMRLRGAAVNCGAAYAKATTNGLSLMRWQEDFAEAADEIECISKILERIVEIDGRATQETWGTDLNECAKLARAALVFLCSTALPRSPPISGSPRTPSTTSSRKSGRK